MKTFLFKHRLLVGILSGFCLVVLGVTYVFSEAIYDYEDTVDGVHLPSVDAIVCLAGGRGRIALAADTWYRYFEQADLRSSEEGIEDEEVQVPLLYFSGMGKKTNWAVLSKQVRRGVLEALRPEQVELETQSGNTEENARFLAQYARGRGWSRILLVTSSYHMRRAKFIFDAALQQLNPPVAVETLSLYHDPFDSEEWRSGLHGVRVTMAEYFKGLYYRFFWKP